MNNAPSAPSATEKPLISVVSPVYGAEQIVDKLVERVSEEVSQITDSYEIVLVEDCGPDNSWARIVANCQQNPRVKGARLSRNFGQHYALSAGLQLASGQYVVVMDCDLQDNPRYIHDLYAEALKGHDVVYTHKTQRKHSVFKNITARLFFHLFNWLSDQKRSKADAQTGTFSLLSRKAVNAFNAVKDYHRHYLMVLRWVGLKSTSVEIEHEARYAGKSSYTLRKLINHAINGITSQSDKLLRISVGVGLVYFAVSIVASLYLTVSYFVYGYKEGWASTIVIILISTGFILMALGITGIYIGKIFEQVKGRPLFIIDQQLNFNSDTHESHGPRVNSSAHVPEEEAQS